MIVLKFLSIKVIQKSLNLRGTHSCPQRSRYFCQYKESRPLGRSNFRGMRREFVSYSQPIRLSDLTLSMRKVKGSHFIADFVLDEILGTDKEERGLWGRQCDHRWLVPSENFKIFCKHRAAFFPSQFTVWLFCFYTRSIGISHQVIKVVDGLFIILHSQSFVEAVDSFCVLGCEN